MTAPTQARPIEVSIAHRDPYVAAGVASLLRSHDDFVVRMRDADGDVHQGSDASRVFLADYETGLRVAAAIRAERRRTAPNPVLVLTGQCTGWQIRKAVDAGVRGYLLHDCTAEELFEAVRCVADQRRYLSCEMADQLLDTLAAAVPTSRELEVLQLIAHGLANKEIGRRLGIGEGAVKTHVKALLRKLGEPTRTGVIAEAFRRGMLLEPAP